SLAASAVAWWTLVAVLELATSAAHDAVCDLVLEILLGVHRPAPVAVTRVGSSAILGRSIQADASSLVAPSAGSRRARGPMHGLHRIPTLLKRVDRLARDT
ncbi:MAG TPA: hypothetical protein VHT91_22125, partial [Kofleriaceae bacterium]|nr:hypothetical protein [Kofleriaceae bacterium]